MCAEASNKTNLGTCFYCAIKYIDIRWDHKVGSCALLRKDSELNQIGDIEYYSSYDEAYATAVRLFLGQTVSLIPKYAGGISSVLFQVIK